MSDPTQVYLREARLSYPHLVNKQKASEDAKPKYSGVFLLDPTTKLGAKAVKEIEVARNEACLKAFKKPYEKMKFKADRECFVDGDEDTDSNGELKAGYEGMMVIKASNYRRHGTGGTEGMKVLHRNKALVEFTKLEDGTYEAEDDPLYGGCYAQGVLRLYGTTKGGGPGIFASLEIVRFLKDGERFGAAPVDDSILDDFPDDDDDDDDLGV